MGVSVFKLRGLLKKTEQSFFRITVSGLFMIGLVMTIKNFPPVRLARHSHCIVMTIKNFVYFFKSSGKGQSSL